MFASALAAGLLAAAFALGTVRDEPRLVRVVGLRAPDVVALADGSTLALAQLATPGLSEAALQRGTELVRGEWSARATRDWVLDAGPDGGHFEHTWQLYSGDDDAAVRLARAGLGVPRDLAGESTGAEFERLVAAATSAQRDGAGLWSERRRPPAALETVGPDAARPRRLAPPAAIAGVALPLHSKFHAYDYGRELAELAELGATWVSLLVVVRQERVDSSRVPLSSHWTPSPGRVQATIERARALGLEVLLMPLVLIEKAGPDDWRGTLAPEDEDAWWRSYGALVCAMADVATESGASAFCVGSEYGSLEHEEARWRHVIANVRARFPGWLTYSANWDHLRTVRFWDALDFAGMTGYFELAPSDSPSAQELEKGWRVARDELWALRERCELPVVLTEVGVPSRVGGAATPWDHTRRAAAPDLAGQRAAFAAFRRVFTPDGTARDPAWLGVFLYDWWGEGGERDTGYTARGKPAAAEWRALLRDLAP